MYYHGWFDSNDSHDGGGDDADDNYLSTTKEKRF